MNLAKHWRLKGARYRLEGQRHRDGRLRFPAQPDRPGETAGEWQTHAFSGLGEVWSWTVQSANSERFDVERLVVALVRLAEGPLITAQLTDCDPEELRIGLPVELVIRRLGDAAPDGLLAYGYKFRPRLLA